MSLRQQGLTPKQLEERYYIEVQKPYGDVDIIALFGKPPYEFLGDTKNRDYPNYKDFHPEFVDQEGREYQRTDAINRFFVRIPVKLTKAQGSDSERKYEDYVGFPRSGERVNLSSWTQEIHATVSDCPFDFRRAVSNILFENMLTVDFVPDFVDRRGRYYMRCVRNECILQMRDDDRRGLEDGNDDGEDGREKDTPDSSHSDVALYYVRLPSLPISRMSKKDTQNTRKVATMLSRDFASRTRPYIPDRAISDLFAGEIGSSAASSTVPWTGEEFIDVSDKGQQKGLGVLCNFFLEGENCLASAMDHVERDNDNGGSSSLGKRKATVVPHTFPRKGETVDAFQLFENRILKLEIENDKQVRSDHSPLASAIVVVRITILQ